MKKQYLEIGKIVTTHGIRGEVKVQPWCDGAEVLCGLDTLYWKSGDPVPVESARVHKGMALLKLEGVEDPEAAVLLRNRVLYADRKDFHLEKGCYFVQDLLGMKVLDADSGREYGALTDVLKTGANDVYEVTRDGKQWLIPAIPDVVVKTDVDAGELVIRPLKGIFDDGDSD